jgi:hypothetical protein
MNFFSFFAFAFAAVRDVSQWIEAAMIDSPFVKFTPPFSTPQWGAEWGEGIIGNDRESLIIGLNTIFSKATVKLIAIPLSRSETIKIPFCPLNSSNQFRL